MTAMLTLEHPASIAMRRLRTSHRLLVCVCLRVSSCGLNVFVRFGRAPLLPVFCLLLRVVEDVGASLRSASPPCLRPFAGRLVSSVFPPEMRGLRARAKAVGTRGRVERRIGCGPLAIKSVDRLRRVNNKYSLCIYKCYRWGTCRTIGRD